MNEKVRAHREQQYKEKLKPAYDAFMKVYPFTVDDLDGEEWRDIAGTDGEYQISNYGRVKSYSRHREGKILKPALHNGGRLYINLSKNEHKFIHALVAKAFIPNPDSKPQVDHINGDKMNNCVNNLRWVTKIENERYSWQTGLRQTGGQHHNAKLTSEQIAYIRENPDNLMVKELAEKFGVSNGRISSIQTGRGRTFEGGTIRESKTPPSLPPAIQAQIRAEYRKGVRGFGTPALAKKYGVHPSTIQSIIERK